MNEEDATNQHDGGSECATGLSVLIIFGFFAAIAAMLFIEMPEKNATMLNIMIGGMAAAFAGVVNYHFGSTAGSVKKTDAVLGALSRRRRASDPWPPQTQDQSRDSTPPSV